MPAFAGYLGGRSSGVDDGSSIHRMTDGMLHEPHHVADSQVIDAWGAIGHVRDTGVDGGIAAGWSEEKDIFVLLIGECVLPGDEAAGDGIAPRQLIALYTKHGSEFPKHLNGWFSGLIIDQKQGRAILFNDRFGQSRVYIASAGGKTWFASEAKAILAVLPECRSLDDRGLAEMHAVGCVLQNRTIFNGITLLPPGSSWVIRRDGAVQRSCYFDQAEWERQEPLDEESYEEQLIDVFSRITPRFLNGSPKVGMSLTGGLDSRAILAWTDGADKALPCYTFGGPYRDCADVRIARRLADVCGLGHQTLPVERDFFGDFEALARKSVYVSDGSMDISGAIEIYMNRKARQIAPIRVTGNYGSEILRQNVAFRPRPFDRSLYTPEFSSLMDEAAATYRLEADGSRMSFIAFKQVPWHHHARKAVEQSQLQVRSPYLDNELVALAYRVPESLRASPGPLLKLMAAGNPALESVPTDRAYRTRQLAMVTGLARRWHEFTAKAEYAYDYGMPTALARADQMLSALRLERLFLGRHKFYHFRIWYKRQLRQYLEEHSSRSLGGSVYREDALKRMAGQHLSGQANHTLDLHRAISLGLIQQAFVEAK